MGCKVFPAPMGDVVKPKPSGGNKHRLILDLRANGVNDVASAGARSYFGGDVDATALATVFREIPNRSAICVFGTPSAANLRINAQSSKVITLRSW